MKFKTAYSIVELLVVIGIISLLVGILVPLLGMYAPGTQLRGDAKITLSALRKVQQLAITEQRRSGIDFYPSENKYILFRKDAETGNTQEIQTEKLSTGITIDKINFDSVEETLNSEGYIRIQFDSYGAPRDAEDNNIHAEIILKNSKNATLQIDVRKNTGHVKIE